MTFKISLDCDLDKDLSKSEGRIQLVKYKDTWLYLQLYIPRDYIMGEANEL